MSKKISIILGCAVLVLGITFGVYAIAKNSTFNIADASDCNIATQLKGTITDAKAGKATIVNNSDCTFKFNFRSYKMFDQNISNQEFFDGYTGRSIGPNQTQNLDIRVPSCSFQIDISFNDPQIGFRNIGHVVEWNGGYCTHTPPPPVEKGCIAISKEVFESNGTTRNYTVSGFTFKLNQTGATMTTGTDGNVTFSNLPMGHYVVVELPRAGYNYKFPADGSLDIDVTQPASQGCVHGTFKNTKDAPVTPNLSGYCVANPSQVRIGETVTWNATANGGNGNYTYTWSGWDNLSGSSASVQKSYTYAGTKPSQVVITSGNQSITKQCTTTVVENPTPNLHAYCTSSTSSTNVGSTVTYSAHASGSNGSYSYSWNGTDGLYGSNQWINQTYYSSGYKAAHVTVSSNGQSITVTCSTNIYQTQADLNGSCWVNPSTAYVNETVTWNASATGGNGNYTYSWNGWDNLGGYGSSVSKQYSYAGQKTGTVTITSNGQTISKTCYMNVIERTQNMYGTCSVYPTTAYVGDTVNWSANPSNGNGYYTYSWNGTDGVYNSNQSFTSTYNSTGQKQATVTIYSNGQNVSQTCYVNIIDRPTTVTLTSQPGPTYTGGVYLSQVPYTGIGSNTKVALFIIGLFAWSAAVAYFLIARKARKQGLTVGQFLGNMSAPQNGLSFAGMSAPVVSIPKQEIAERIEVMKPAALTTGDFMTDLESRARASNMIISEDALKLIAVVSGRDTEHAHAMVDELATMYRGSVTEESDWVSLNAEKVSKIISHVRA